MMTDRIRLRTGLVVLLAGALAACADNGGEAGTGEPAASGAAQPLVTPAEPATPAAEAAAGPGADKVAAAAGVAESAQALAEPGKDAPDAAADVEQLVEQATQAAAELPGEQKAQTCLSCHSVDNFAEFDAAALEAAMQSMRTGEMAHLPLPASLTDQDLADIAAYLAEAAGAAES